MGTNFVGVVYETHRLLTLMNIKTLDWDASTMQTLKIPSKTEGDSKILERLTLDRQLLVLISYGRMYSTFKWPKANSRKEELGSSTLHGFLSTI